MPQFDTLRSITTFTIKFDHSIAFAVLEYASKEISINIKTRKQLS